MLFLVQGYWYTCTKSCFSVCVVFCCVFVSILKGILWSSKFRRDYIFRTNMALQSNRNVDIIMFIMRITVYIDLILQWNKLFTNGLDTLPQMGWSLRPNANNFTGTILKWRYHDKFWFAKWNITNWTWISSTSWVIIKRVWNYLKKWTRLGLNPI